jgi:hypothetical protein
MAINTVGYVPPEKVSTSGGKKSGGKLGGQIGAVAGGVVGGMAGAVVGAGAPPAAPATIALGAAGGAALGNGLGTMIGEQVKPGREATTAIDRRAQQTSPQLIHSEQSQQLKQSLVALQQQPPEVRQQYHVPLAKAYIQSVGLDNQNKTGQV